MTLGLSQTVNGVLHASSEVAGDRENVSTTCSELLGRVDQQASMLTQTASAKAREAAEFAT